MGCVSVDSLALLSDLRAWAHDPGLRSKYLVLITLNPKP